MHVLATVVVAGLSSTHLGSLFSTGSSACPDWHPKQSCSQTKPAKRVADDGDEISKEGSVGSGARH